VYPRRQKTFVLLILIFDILIMSFGNTAVSGGSVLPTKIAAHKIISDKMSVAASSQNFSTEKQLSFGSNPLSKNSSSKNHKIAIPTHTEDVNGIAKAAGLSIKKNTGSAKVRKSQNINQGTENLFLELKPRNTDFLYKYANLIDKKDSPYYHLYLNSKQISRLFSPSAKAVAQVEKLLKLHGFHIGQVPSDNLLIPFKGSVANVDSYFKSATTGQSFRLNGSFTDSIKPYKINTVANDNPMTQVSVNRPTLPKQLKSYAVAVLNSSNALMGGQFAHASFISADNVATQHNANSRDAAAKDKNHQLWVSGLGSNKIIGSGQSNYLITSRSDEYHTGKLLKSSSLENPTFTNPAAAHACPSAAADAASANGWTENAIANAYGLGPLYDQGDLGQGETIAVFELEPFSNADLAAFEKCYFGKSFLGNVTRIPIDGFSLKGSGSGEAILDIELLSALVPKARLLVYEAPNTASGVLEAYNNMVMADKANIITTSWGECEAAIQASAPGMEQLENFIFEEAAIEGITVFAATGDDGADDCASTPYGSNVKVSPYLSVDDPASQPFVVGVGGTTLLSSTNPPVQSAWNDGAAGGGGGGGLSVVWPSPPWQNSSLVPGTIKNTYRQLPDISATANEYYGVTVYSHYAYGSSYIRSKTKTLLHGNQVIGSQVVSGEKVASKRPRQLNHRVIISPKSQNILLGGWTAVGGTSEAAPLVAASMALIASSSACNGLRMTRGGPDLGFVAPLLYELASNPTSYAQSFNQITSGSNDIFHDQKGYHAAPGYNLVTGLGSPLVTDSGGSPALDANLCRLALSQSANSSSPSPAGNSSGLISGNSGIYITSVTPNQGSVLGNQTVSISGKGFGTSPAAVSLYFGDKKARIISVDQNQIVADSPPSPIYHSSSPFDGVGEVDISITKTLSGGITVSVPGPQSVFNYLELDKGYQAKTNEPIVTTTPSPGSITNNGVRPVITAVGPGGGKKNGGTRVTIFGNGFTEGGKIKSVLFGGRKAKSYKVVSDHQIVATAPAMDKKTKCKAGKGFNPSVVCQTEVQVADEGGKSPLSHILPPEEGNILIAPGSYDEPVKGREITPAVTEFDYANPPVIQTVDTADQTGSSNIPLTITGKNFNILTLEWVNVGSPREASSEQTKFVYISNNLLIVIAATLPNSVVSDPGSKQISIQGVAGLSKPARLNQVAGN